MKKLIALTAVAASFAALPTLGLAQEKKEAAPEHTLTGNVGFVSEYRYRGISQTNKLPALQGGFDYAHASGFYAGTWASNVSWLSDLGLGASSSLEWDLYGGYKGTAGDISYDVGGLYYYYPGKYSAAPYKAAYTKPDTFELYGAITYSIFTLKYSHALTDIFGNKDSKGAGYLDLSATYDLGDGMNVVGHVGHQMIKATSATTPARTKSGCSYTDYKLGITKDVSGYVFGAAYIGTNAKGDAGQCYYNAYNKDIGAGTVVLSVVKSF